MALVFRKFEFLSAGHFISQSFPTIKFPFIGIFSLLIRQEAALVIAFFYVIVYVAGKGRGDRILRINFIF